MKKIYALVILMSFLACENSKQNTATSNEAIETVENTNSIEVSKQQFDGEKMQLGALEKYNFNTVVKANGIIDVPPENKANISTFMDGYVTKIPLLIGDKVKKGQLIASLQNTSYVEIQQNYLEIAAELSFLKNEYNRQKTLFDEKITSQKSYLKAESVYKSSLATYNGLRKKLQMMNINPSKVEQGDISSIINLYAPINGFVTKVNVSIGSFVSAASELIQIINTDHLHVELNVFEKDILKIKKDQDIQFKIPEASEKTFDAAVHLVGTSINTNRIIKVHGHINDDENNNFMTGMFVEAAIIIKAKNTLAIQKSAVITENDAKFVLVLKQEKNGNFIFDKKQIETGLEDENYFEVLNTENFNNKKILKNGIYMLLSDN